MAQTPWAIENQGRLPQLPDHRDKRVCPSQSTSLVAFRGLERRHGSVGSRLAALPHPLASQPTPTPLEGRARPSQASGSCGRSPGRRDSRHLHDVLTVSIGPTRSAGSRRTVEGEIPNGAPRGWRGRQVACEISATCRWCLDPAITASRRLARPW